MKFNKIMIKFMIKYNLNIQVLMINGKLEEIKTDKRETPHLE